LRRERVFGRHGMGFGGPNLRRGDALVHHLYGITTNCA
jgi:hypothetical protein